MPNRSVDCLVVGGGPAGLTAAIYLSRFHLSVLVIDAGHSRAALIPKTRNHAGFPEGITGPNLLRRMSQQARIYGAAIEQARVESIERSGEEFVACGSFGKVQARCVLLATGVVNNRPAMPDEMHDEALARGLLRYCPICDAYEVTDKAVAVIGTGERGVRETLFLRSYTADLTLIAPDGVHELDAGERSLLADAGVRLVEGFVPQMSLGANSIQITTDTGMLSFASIYPALGSVIRSELAVALGADTSSDGCLRVDAHQRTSLAGLYAAGDVVQGLDQISHAMGEGGVAATTMRNDLAEQRPHRR
jgi:thioredoxin reductase (NADPH)